MLLQRSWIGGGGNSGNYSWVNRLARRSNTTRVGLARLAGLPGLAKLAARIDRQIGLVR
jgi:hypothetical protein